jgi:methylmalonyl-CoA mutase
MADSPVRDLLKQSFPESHKRDWLRVASSEIQGKNPFENLAWKSPDGLAFLPYYDKADCETLRYLKNFEFSPSADPHSGARAWKNLPKITVSDARKSNQVAQEHLANGADGILFDVSDGNVVDINVLLESIDWHYCDVSFLTDASSRIIQPIISHIEKQKYDLNLLCGTFFWKQRPKDAVAPLLSFSGINKFQSLGIYINPSSPVKEVSEALAEGVRLMDLLTDQRTDKALVWQNLTVSFATGTDFFLEIAKLKAFRLLWYQVAQAFGVDSAPADLKIHARSLSWTNEDFQPRGNLLKSTGAALSSVLGGCDVLTVEPEDEFNPTMNRIARNVSSIIREEAHIDRVSDPLAGAYTVDKMVDTIAEAAWLDFKLKIRET